MSNAIWERSSLGKAAWIIVSPCEIVDVIPPMRNDTSLPLLGFREQFAADQHAADFAGAGADFIQFGVAPQAADRILVDVAVAAQRLDRLAGHPGGFFGAVQDGAG